MMKIKKDKNGLIRTSWLKKKVDGKLAAEPPYPSPSSSL